MAHTHGEHPSERLRSGRSEGENHSPNSWMVKADGACDIVLLKTEIKRKMETRKIFKRVSIERVLEGKLFSPGLFIYLIVLFLAATGQ